jgi:prophage regulatory protein
MVTRSATRPAKDKKPAARKKTAKAVGGARAAPAKTTRKPVARAKKPVKAAIPKLRRPQTAVSEIALDTTLPPPHSKEKPPPKPRQEQTKAPVFELARQPPAKAARTTKIKRPARAPPVPIFRFDIDALPPLLRLTDIVRDPKRNYPGLVPVSRAAWLHGVAEGYFPPPLKVGPKSVAWRRDDLIRVLVDGAFGVKRTAVFAEVVGRPYRPPQQTAVGPGGRDLRPPAK